jgi:hypothetical protein
MYRRVSRFLFYREVQKMIGILDTLRDTAGEVEGLATDAVAKVAPWCAPIPTAYLVGRATVEHLAWPGWVGIVAAVIVESLGLATTATALELRQYNASKRKSDPRGPFTLAALLVGVYLVVAVGLTVALDILPVLAVYSPAVFPLLSLCGVTTLAIRSDHKRRLEAIAQDKAQRRASRKARKAEKERDVSGRNVFGKFTSQETIERARAILVENPDISGAELGRQLGKSAGLGRKLRQGLLAEISDNGRGGQ